MIDDVTDTPQRLRIALPAYTGQLTIETLGTILGILQACAERGITVEVDPLAGCCYVDEARNALVGRFLASGADRLLFLDTDVGAEPDAIAKLLDAQKAVVAGVYPRKSDARSWPVLVADGPMVKSLTGCYEAVGIPTGFLLIHREVLVTMQPQMPAYTDNQGLTQHGYFQCLMDGKYWGEDYVFCQKVRALGGKVWFRPDITFQHVGLRKWHGNYQDWLNEQEPIVQGLQAHFATIPGDYRLSMHDGGWFIQRPRQEG